MSSLVVEVLSESTRHKDMLKKLVVYMTGGVGEYWIVNPDNRSPCTLSRHGAGLVPPGPLPKRPCAKKSDAI